MRTSRADRRYLEAENKKWPHSEYTPHLRFPQPVSAHLAQAMTLRDLWNWNRLARAAALKEKA